MKYRYAAVLLISLVAWMACRSPRDTAHPTPESFEEPIKATEGQDAALTLSPEEAASFAARIQEQVDARAPHGLVLTLWATEQLIEDPIAIDVDERGMVFVTGSGRSGGLLDIRGHPTWVAPALAMQTVEEHESFLKQELAPERSSENEWLPDFNADGSRDWRDLTVNTDRVYIISDADGDGLADRAHILIENFNRVVTDVAGGLLAFNGHLYVSAAPDLWLMEDAAKTGRIADKHIISTGFGVHPGFFGHGMSGIAVGPEGRIYWSVGDMGYNVTGTDGRQWVNPNEGAIFRAFPDGSGFEVFATGLRNTHEFAFDEYGNLISVDNDGDHPGEEERVVYIVEGSDSGWRTNWQYGKYTDERNNAYKVWMDEELFKPHFDGQAAYILPPIANYHAGPAGMAYNPGTALSEDWLDYFFVAEYTGTPATSNVYAFRLEEKGAGFELADDTAAVSGILPVGMAFGPDGALYLADWIDGWGSKGAGRIWRLAAEGDPSPIRNETMELLAADFSLLRVSRLTSHLEHPDLRVRRKAQFELAARSEADALREVLRRSENRLARIHALWGLWQLALDDAWGADRLVPYLSDSDPEIRAQAAKILGDVQYYPAASALVPLVSDSSARVRFFATEALGRMEHEEAFEPIVQMLEANAGKDVYLRHAGSIALSRLDAAARLAGLSRHPSKHVRLAAVVALRRMGNPAVTAFLDDPDQDVVTEAARAINDDGGIVDAIPQLASILTETPHSSEPLLRRVLNANLRSGTTEDADRVAAYALREDAPTPMRVEAVDILGVWPDPSPFDRVDGLYLGPAPRTPEPIQEIATAAFTTLLTGTAPAEVKVAAARAASRLDLSTITPTLADRLSNDKAPAVRAAALSALQDLGWPQMQESIELALNDSEAEVRLMALSVLPDAGLAAATTATLLSRALDGGTVAEQQSALASLADIDAPEAHDILETQMERLAAGAVPEDVQLDVLEAAVSSSSDRLREQANAFRASTSPFIGIEYGGDPRRGSRIYYQNQAAQCTRCHAIFEIGGAVGPNLEGVGSRLTREELAESLIDPSAQIAVGYGEGVSAMPPMGYVLTPMQLRDIVAFLASLE